MGERLPEERPKPRWRPARIDVVPATARPIMSIAVALSPADLSGRFHFIAQTTGASLSGVIAANSAEDAVIELIHRVRRGARVHRIRFVVALPHQSPMWRIADEVPILLPGVTVDRPALLDLPLIDVARSRVAAAAAASRALPQAKPIAILRAVDTSPVTVATDGSVRGSYTGWGWLASTGDFGLLGFRHDTRQVGTRVVLIAELRAIGDAIRRLKGRKLTILTDSRQALNMISDWMNGSDRLPSGYTTDRANGESGLIKIRRLVICERDNLTLRWVPGHAGEPLNEGADALARLASRYARGDSELNGMDYPVRAAGLARAFAEHYNRQCGTA
ncbi:ribonuclease HI [Aldersonia kunmingensis]|uniref:ribonuclease HI n=1 Tax=Aldersonia kunmingensis TaxID=408066 RepID=UPI000830479E|nr:RNase H family protein [Aldersonia kunmingensis]